MLVNVEGSGANKGLAMEKALTKPASQRRCAGSQDWLEPPRTAHTHSSMKGAVEGSLLCVLSCQAIPDAAHHMAEATICRLAKG